MLIWLAQLRSGRALVDVLDEGKVHVEDVPLRLRQLQAAKVCHPPFPEDVRVPQCAGLYSVLLQKVVDPVLYLGPLPYETYPVSEKVSTVTDLYRRDIACWQVVQPE